MQVRREWSETFKLLREQNHQARILYAAKLTFKHEGEIKTFSNKQKQRREFVASRPALQENLKEVLQREGK